MTKYFKGIFNVNCLVGGKKEHIFWLQQSCVIKLKLVLNHIYVTFFFLKN